MYFSDSGALIARPPADRPAWEPIIVTTLRRYVRRRAPASLVQRLAGGAAPWRLLNETWDIDGHATRAAITLIPVAARERRSPLPELGVVLSLGERRIALLQIIVDYAVAGETFPASSQLARYLGCHPDTINGDLDWLRSEGRIACGLRSNGTGPRRVIRVVGTDLETAPPERFT